MKAMYWSRPARPNSTMSEFGTRPFSSTGSTTRRTMPRLRSSHPSRSSASNLGSSVPADIPPTKPSSGFSSLPARARYPFAAVAREAGEMNSGPNRDRAVRRTSSQSSNNDVPPRGLTASAMATVARPAMTPRRAVRRLTTPDYATRETSVVEVSGRFLSVDVGPRPVPLEDDLASLAAKNDLEVAPPDRARVAAAHGTRCHLVLERKRQRFDLDLQTPSFLRHMLHPLLFIDPIAGPLLRRRVGSHPGSSVPPVVRLQRSAGA